MHPDTPGQVPPDLLRNKKLNCKAKIVYSCLTHLSLFGPVTTKAIADMLGIPEKAVVIARKQLRKAGWTT